jgi:hypothetical protein
VFRLDGDLQSSLAAQRRTYLGQFYKRLTGI